MTEFSVQNILLHTQPIFGILSIDFHKNRQKIPILSMLNSRLKCARFHEMGIRCKLHVLVCYALCSSVSYFNSGKIWTIWTS